MLFPLATSLLLLGNFTNLTNPDAKGCTVSLNEDLGDPQALFLKADTTLTDNEAFLQPSENSELHFTKSDTFLVSCPGSLVSIKSKPTKSSTATVSCSSGKTFKVGSASVKFENITCTKHPEPFLEYNDYVCADGDSFEIDLGFQLDSERYFSQIIACFNPDLQTAVYSTYNLTRAIGGYQANYPRPSFKESGFYNLGKTKVDTLYGRNTQRETINKLLGLPAKDTKWIHQSNDYYLARGHLAAKTDFLYGQQQRLTFNFVNAAPQWQTLNAGNWLTLEYATRNYASDHGVDLVVHTGIHGIATLPHEETGEETELYLYAEDFKAIPVPELFWKVVYDPENKAGVAFIAVNNPYLEEYQPICQDICQEISWIKWDATDQKSGFVYCCTVEDFRKTVDYIPEFPVSSLLT